MLLFVGISPYSYHRYWQTLVISVAHKFLLLRNNLLSCESHVPLVGRWCPSVDFSGGKPLPSDCHSSTMLCVRVTSPGPGLGSRSWKHAHVPMQHPLAVGGRCSRFPALSHKLVACPLYHATWVVSYWFSRFLAGDPANDVNIVGDPFKTLFVARVVRIPTCNFLASC